MEYPADRLKISGVSIQFDFEMNGVIFFTYALIFYLFQNHFLVFSVFTVFRIFPFFRFSHTRPLNWIFNIFFRFGQISHTKAHTVVKDDIVASSGWEIQLCMTVSAGNFNIKGTRGTRRTVLRMSFVRSKYCLQFGCKNQCTFFYRAISFKNIDLQIWCENFPKNTKN